MDNFNNQQPYGQMNQPYGQMNQPYGQMNQPYGQMNQQYGQMNQQYGQMNQSYGQMNQQYGQQLQYGYSPYGQMKKPVGDISVFILKLISVIFIFISPIFSWAAFKVDSYDKDESEKVSANLFKLGTDRDIFYKGAFFLILAIIIMVTVLVMFIMDFSEFSPAIKNFKTKMGSFNIDYLFLAIFIIIFIAIFYEPDIMSAVADSKEEIKEMISDGEIKSGYCNHGLGPIFMLVGIGIRIISDILEGVRKKKQL